MKNNSEIVNNMMCKSCFKRHKETTGHEPIDCAFKAFDNEYCEEAQELADYITNQDTKWQKLKEILKRQIDIDSKEYLESGFAVFKNYVAVENFILQKMQELEAEDEI